MNSEHECRPVVFERFGYQEATSVAEVSHNGVHCNHRVQGSKTLHCKVTEQRRCLSISCGRTSAISGGWFPAATGGGRFVFVEEVDGRDGGIHCPSRGVFVVDGVLPAPRSACERSGTPGSGCDLCMIARPPQTDRGTA